MPTIDRLLETSLYVENIRRSANFYVSVLGLSVLDSDERFGALSVAGSQVVLLFRKGFVSTEPGPIPEHEGSGRLHVAFAISHDSLQHWETSLSQNGVSVESRVSWPRGGTSLYFRDPDQHLIELATPGLWAIY